MIFNISKPILLAPQVAHRRSRGYSTYFVRTHTIKAGKLLSFHADAVVCIKKGKAGNSHEFGRVFQLGRIGGNFLVAFSATGVRMEDKHSLLPAIEEHQSIFGEGTLKEISKPLI